MKPVCQLSRATMLWLIITILMVVTPFAGSIPVWLYPLALLTMGWRLMIHSGRWQFPHWALKLLLLLVCVIGLMVSLGDGSTINATVALLVATFLIKLLEMYQRRDALVVLFVAYLLVAAVFLFNQSIPMALYALLTLIVITASLNSVYRGEQNRNFWQPLKRSGILILQAIPMMLVLFLIFPRIAPLWQIDLDTGQAFTGLSDTMAPGDVSRLTRSGAIAFQVNFDAVIPSENQRYWRGIVYDHYDGQRWTRAEPVSAAQAVQWPQGLATATESYSYQLIMEPTGQQWRYVLDLPQKIPSYLKRLEDYTVISDQPLLQRVSYPVTSTPGNAFQRLNRTQLQRYLQLPHEGNPQTRELAQRWREESQGNATAIVRRVMSHFTQQFAYTLEPPRLRGDRIDQFLFQSQRGFCGHYAGASVFLLRAAGIPARVVGGYQGGELNPLNNTMTVRQYEAHAWIEVWLKDHWQRLDPTAMVAPERIEQSVQDAFRTGNSFSNESGFLANAFMVRASLQHQWLQQLRWQYDALNFSWHRWVLNFHGHQLDILNDLLGGMSILKMLLLFLVPSAAVLALVIFSLLLAKRQPVDPVEGALAKLDRRLAKLGLQRSVGETVLNHADRVADVIPAIAGDIREVARCYARIRYAEENSDTLKKQLYAAVDRCYSLIPSR